MKSIKIIGAVWVIIGAYLLLSPLAVAQNLGDIRLSGSCRGSLEVYQNSLIHGARFFDVCDSNFGDEEARVVCRQLGCNPEGARKSTASLGIFVYYLTNEGYSCNGSESSLSRCQRASASCPVQGDIEAADIPSFAAITCGPSPPSEPEDVMVEGISPTILRVTWDPPSYTNNGGSVTTYQISLDGEVVATVPRDLNLFIYTQQYLFVNLTADTTYSVQVRARNSAGYGPSVNLTGNTLSADQPHGIIDAPQVTSNPPITTITWTHPGGSVDSYLVQYVRFPFDFDYRGVQNLTVAGTSTSVEINTTGGSRYTVRVAAQNQIGLSAFSPETQIFIPAPTSLPTTLPTSSPTTAPPTTPTSGTIRLSGGCGGNLEIYLNGLIYGARFYDVCDGNFGDEEARVVCRQLGCNPEGARKSTASIGYFVYYSTNEGYSCSGSESSLSRCQRRSASCPVQGGNIEPEDRASFVAVTCGPSPPSEPNNVVVEGMTTTILRVSWEHPSHSNNGGSITTYQVSLDGEVVATVPIGSGYRPVMRYLVRNLNANARYSVQVRARNSAGYGPPASSTARTLTADEPHAIIDAPQAVSNPPITTITWTHPGGNVDSYLVQYVRFPFDFESFISDYFKNLTVAGTELSVEINNLVASERYTVRVAAMNQNGLSAFSPETEFYVRQPNLPTSSPPSTSPSIRLRLSGTCRGSLEIYNDPQFGSARYYDVCDRNFGDEEAQVVCRQLGCNPVGAKRVIENLPFTATIIRRGYSCTGTESSLSSCQTTSATCGISGFTLEDGDERDLVNIRCGPEPGQGNDQVMGGGNNKGTLITVSIALVWLVILITWMQTYV